MDAANIPDTIINKIAITESGKLLIDLDKKHFRPSEVDFLRGDFSKARKNLKWFPSISTNELIEDMINDELSIYK